MCLDCFRAAPRACLHMSSIDVLHGIDKQFVTFLFFPASISPLLQPEALSSEAWLHGCIGRVGLTVPSCPLVFAACSSRVASVHLQI